jgi:hypothetical protein
MIETREYPVPLTEEELKMVAADVGRVHREIQREEAAFEELRQEYKASIKGLRSGLVVLLEKLSSRREVREVELEILYNSPEKGMKQIFLNSTGALIDTVEMTADDEQDLFADAESRSEEESTESGEEEESNLSDSEMRDADLLRRRKGEPAAPGRSLASCWLDEPEGEVCAVCHEAHYVLHINNEKPVCHICREHLNNKKIPEIDVLEKHWKGRGSNPPLFRAEFGNGCSHLRSDTTCFRFMLKSGSWGNHAYMAGDFTFEGSEAFVFYNNLLQRGWAEDK